MSFAERYINRNILFHKFIPDLPSHDLGIAVIIPVNNEPELIKALNSLASCHLPECGVEVIIVVNESETCTQSVREQNLVTIKEIDQWLLVHPGLGFRVHVIHPDPFPKKHAGAGLARKTGMDEAVCRFHHLNKPEGVLVSLDADTTVSKNYLVEIENYFKKHEKVTGVTIRFAHRINEISDKRQQEGILLYEKYLHYYKKAMEFTGFPHAIYTIGSAFAVRADAYVKQGGMSKRQAGEDFYFLHKLTQVGEIAELNTTCVYPSARISDRVPFGTGPILRRWMQGDESLNYTYNMHAFINLKEFFASLPDFYELNFDSITESKLGKALCAFLLKEDFSVKLNEIKMNSSTFETFGKRFFQYFNAFKILKFLNFAHSGFYKFQDLNEAEKQLHNLC